MNDKHFWFYLLNISETIDAIDPGAEDAVAQLEAQLESLAEVFRGTRDPVDELEKYTALTLSNSIRRLLAARRNATTATTPRHKTRGMS